MNTKGGTVNIGFIGTGQMGSQMAQHILEAGYELIASDIRKEAAQALLDKGAQWRDTPREIAESCRIVLSSLPGPREVEAVVYGKNGLMEGWKKGDIFVDMTTNSPTTIRRIAEDARAKGVEALDAPVSGGTKGAEEGTLSIIVGGDKQTLHKVKEILNTMGTKIFHVGDVGCGNVVKLVNNIISTTTHLINAESMVLGVKAGVDAERLREVIVASTGNNWWLERKYPQSVMQGDFEPGFRITLALKDISLALALGRELGVSQPVAAVTEQRFLEAKTAGLGEKGTQALILRLEELAGVQVRAKEIT